MIRILLADDTPVFRRFLEKSLTIAGYDVEGVESASDVLGAVDRFAPHVVVLDWHFAGRPSEDLFRELQGRNLPVIVITGDPGAVNHVGVPVLSKPVRLEELRHQLEKACRPL